MKSIYLLILFVSSLLLYDCSRPEKKSKEIEKVLTTESTCFSNPILTGFYPDPSICKVDEVYYLINSSFSYFPGIPIFKSVDLVNWKQVGNVLDRPNQINLQGLGVSRGIFAPAISSHKGMLYVIGTLVGGGGNFIVSATAPEGPWTDPVWIPEIDGIDPSLFFDDSDKAYIVYNSNPPDKKPLYDGHRTIRMVEFDIASLKVIDGSEKILVNGGTDLSKQPVWIEGPHIYKKNNFYYLIAAEGGTGENHSQVVFRSDAVSGPYKSFAQNPILTQKQLDPERKNPVTNTGHADFVIDANGDWWAVFLGSRPYGNNHYNTGRETFLARVRWENDWPSIELEGALVKYKYANPKGVLTKESKGQHHRNSFFKDDFNSDVLAFEWLFLRNPTSTWHHLENGVLKIETRAERVAGFKNPSFIGYRQEHMYGEVSTEVSFKPLTEQEHAGLIVFQNESHYYYLAITLVNGKPTIQLLKSNGNTTDVLTEHVLKTTDNIKLKIASQGNSYSFFYVDEPGSDWKLLEKNISASFLSTKEAGGFVGCVYGMYTTSLGEKSANSALFYWFENSNKDIFN